MGVAAQIVDGFFEDAGGGDALAGGVDAAVALDEGGGGDADDGAVVLGNF